VTERQARSSGISFYAVTTDRFSITYIHDLQYSCFIGLSNMQLIPMHTNMITKSPVLNNYTG